MRRFTLVQEIAGSVDDHWKLFLDDEFDRRQYLEGFGFPKYELLEHKDSESQITRKIRVQPKLDVPAAVAKLLGDKFGYVEESVFDKTSRVYRAKMTTNVLSDRLFSDSVVRVEPAGTANDRCRRTCDLSVEAKIFGIGGLVEVALEKNLRDGWEKGAAYMNQQLRARAQAPRES
jgi:hypothetical protein